MGTIVRIMPHMSPVLGRGPRTACQRRPVIKRGHIMAPAVRVWLPDVSGHKVILGRDMWEYCGGSGNSLRTMGRCS